LLVYFIKKADSLSISMFICGILFAIFAFGALNFLYKLGQIIQSHEWQSHLKFPHILKNQVVFEDMRKELYEQWPEKWALFYNGKFISVFNSDDNALDYGCRTFGKMVDGKLKLEIFIHQILLEDTVHRI